VAWLLAQHATNAARSAMTDCAVANLKAGLAGRPSLTPCRETARPWWMLCLASANAGTGAARAPSALRPETRVKRADQTRAKRRGRGQ
jgi:hypothetical protein